MRTIHSLPSHLISKIKAGEVVERPASVVKELVENSLDAGAHTIQIHLEKGGIKKILVKDDGKGMNADDILVSFLPHTTSKLTNDEDLFNIHSFGFRGEALASIASVSLMTIKSREHTSESGNIAEIQEGKLEYTSPIGMPPGTEISVESLFISTPARKKFLKEPGTELRHVAEVVTRIALSHPGVSFKLIHEGTLVIDLPETHSAHDRIRATLSDVVADEYIPLNHETRYGKISGFISRPQASTRSRLHQYIFVNNRTVSDPKISQIVSEMYGNLLEPRAFPPFVLYIDLPFESVDVNIHPRKEEVAFAYPHEIKKLVEEAVAASLESHDLIYRSDDRTSFKPGMDEHTARVLKQTVDVWNPKNLDLEEIAQLHNLYLVTHTPKGLLLVDQHAAHERILYEQFKDALQKIQKETISVLLEKPIVFTLSSIESVSLQEHLETFKSLGFDITSFGHNSFSLTHIPPLFKERDLIKLIREVLADLQENRGKAYLDRETDRTLAYLACRSAIKAGDPLTHDERKALIVKLRQSDIPYTCPHGRPTHIELSLKELDRLFKRS